MLTRTTSSTYSRSSFGPTVPSFSPTCRVGRNVTPWAPNPRLAGSVTLRFPPAFIDPRASSAPTLSPNLVAFCPYVNTTGFFRANVSSKTLVDDKGGII